MRKMLLSLGAGALLAAAAVFASIPFAAPKQVCRPVAQWDGKEAGWQFHHPMGLAWGGEFLYVADTENGAVKKLRDDGSLLADWKGFYKPVALAATPDAVYVTDFLADHVTKLNPDDGTVLGQWGRHGNGPGEFDAPSGVAVDEQSFVYVTEFYNHRVQKLNAVGTPVKQWGINGRWNGQFHYPTDIAIGRTGEIYVADGYNHRIQVFTLDGNYLRKWGGTGYGLSGKWGGWFRLSKAVTIDQIGNVYVADAFNHRIQEFSARGHLLGAWSAGTAKERQALRYPSGVAVGPDGAVYVSDFFENRVWKLDCP